MAKKTAEVPEALIALSEGSKMYESQVEREGDDRRPDFLCFLISAGSEQG